LSRKLPRGAENATRPEMAEICRLKPHFLAGTEGRGRQAGYLYSRRGAKLTQQLQVPAGQRAAPASSQCPSSASHASVRWQRFRGRRK